MAVILFKDKHSPSMSGTLNALAGLGVWMLLVFCFNADLKKKYFAFELV